MRVCDPTVGSGGLRIQSADCIKSKGGNSLNLTLHGQERNLNTWAICKMNLLLQGLSDHRIEKDDPFMSQSWRIVELKKLSLFREGNKVFLCTA